MELTSKFAAEFQAIAQAPWTFAIGAISVTILLSLAIWAILNWHYGSQITNLESAKKLLEDRVADYEHKLKGASPSEAQKLVEALQKSVELQDIRIRSLEGQLGNTDVDFVKVYEDALRNTTIIVDGGQEG